MRGTGLAQQLVFAAYLVGDHKRGNWRFASWSKQYFKSVGIKPVGRNAAFFVELGKSWKSHSFLSNGVFNGVSNEASNEPLANYFLYPLILQREY